MSVYNILCGAGLTAVPGTQTFTSSGTFTPPIFFNHLYIELYGGGGSGGSSEGDSATETAGRAGQYRKYSVAYGVLGATESVVVGAGGTAVFHAVGRAGGNSTFGADIYAPGGQGGDASQYGSGLLPASFTPATGRTFTLVDTASTGGGAGGAGGHQTTSQAGSAGHVVITWD